MHDHTCACTLYIVHHAWYIYIVHTYCPLNLARVWNSREVPPKIRLQVRKLAAHKVLGMINSGILWEPAMGMPPQLTDMFHEFSWRGWVETSRPSQLQSSQWKIMLWHPLPKLTLTGLPRSESKDPLDDVEGICSTWSFWGWFFLSWLFQIIYDHLPFGVSTGLLFIFLWRPRRPLANSSDSSRCATFMTCYLCIHVLELYAHAIYATVSGVCVPIMLYWPRAVHRQAKNAAIGTCGHFTDCRDCRALAWCSPPQ